MKGPDGAFRQKQKQKENKNEITTEQVENPLCFCLVPLLHCGVRTAIEQTGNTGSATLGGLACCRPRLEKRSEPAFAGDPESNQGALRAIVQGQVCDRFFHKIGFRRRLCSRRKL